MISKHFFLRALSLAACCALVACSSSDKNTKTAADQTKTQAQSSNDSATTTTTQTTTAKTDDSVSPVEKEKKAVAAYNTESSNENIRVATDIENALRYAHDNNKTAAIQTLDAAAKKSPKAFLVPYNKGLIYEWSGDTNNAAAAYEAALRIEPKFSPALLNLVRLKVSQNQAQAALTVASSYVSNYPDAFDHNIAKLEAMIALKQYDNAVNEARRLLKIDEANPELRYEIALAEYNRNRLNLAEFVVGEALEITPDYVDALFLKARIHHRLVATEPTYATGLAGELDRVLELQPDHIEALWMRGIIYYEANDYTNAEATFRKVIAYAPNLAEGYVNLANVLKTLNKGPEAETNLKKAEQLSPNNPNVEFSFGTLYLNTAIIELPGVDDMDRLNNAKARFQAAASHTTDKAEIKIFNGYIRTTDDAIEALEAAREAEALFGDDEESSDSLE